MSGDLDIIIEQANSAILLRDYEFAEKILISQLKKTDAANIDEVITIKSLLGKLYVRSDSLEKGLAVYRELNKIKPNDIEVLNNMGIIFRRLNLFEDSIMILQDAKKADDKNETTLYNLGSTYKQKGDYKRAAECFNEVLEIKPDDALAYNHLGTVYSLCKDYNKAIDSYKMGLRIDPNHPFLNYNLADIYKLQKRYDEAIFSYNAALKIKPNWCEPLIGIADCYVKTGEFQKAISAYKTIIGIRGANEVDYSAIAQLYEVQKNEVQAEHYYQKAVKINKNFLTAVLGYSKLLKAQNRYYDAFTVLINAKEKNAGNKEFLLNTADISLMLEDYTKAKEIINDLNAKWKGDFGVLKIEGKLFSMLGENKKAEYIFEKLLQISPNEINLRLELGDLYFHNEKFKEAAEQLIKYLNEKPQDVFARLKLGNAYAEMGQYDKAKSEYKKIIKNDSKNTEALAALLELNKTLGNTAKAVQVANDMIQIQSNDENAGIKELSDSLQMYEEAVSSYSDNSILSKNLDLLRTPAGELDLSPQENSDNYESDDELTLNETDEDFSDLEMPFDDLMELAEEETFNKSDEDEFKDVTAFDTPIDDFPENDGFDNTENIGAGFPLSSPARHKQDAMQQEEFQLPDVSSAMQLPAADSADQFGNGVARSPQKEPVRFEGIKEDFAPPASPAIRKSKEVQQIKLDDFFDLAEKTSVKEKTSDEKNLQAPLKRNEEVRPQYVNSDSDANANNRADSQYANTDMDANADANADADANSRADSQYAETDFEDITGNFFSDSESISPQVQNETSEELKQTLSSLTKTTGALTDMADKLAEKLKQLEPLDPDKSFEFAEISPDIDPPEEIRIPNGGNFLDTPFQLDDEDYEHLFKDIPEVLPQSTYINSIPHKLKRSPAFEEELEAIESNEIIKLFSYLRDLLKSLPEENFKQFFISNERIQMEYIIDKLSGEIGLKNRIILMSLKNSLSKTIEPETAEDTRLKATLGYLRIVASELPDKGFAEVCCNKLNELIKQLQ